jgi:hypothetical protein
MRRRLRPLPVLAVFAVFAALAACSGGGDEDGAPQNDPSALTVTPTDVAMIAVEQQPWPASAEVHVTVNHPDAVYVGVGYPPGHGEPAWLFLDLQGENRDWTAVLTAATQGAVPLSLGVYRATVRVAVARGDESLIGWRDVSVVYRLRQGIFVSIPESQFTYVLGGAVPAAGGVYVGGTPGAEWTATASAPWVVVPASGYTNAFVDVGVDPAGLAAGTHQATVTFSALGTSGTSHVTLTIASP